MNKIMISQPMNGFTEEEIVETRNRFLQFTEKENLEVVNTYFQDEWYSKDAMTERGVVQIPLCFLAKSIENMSLCHKAYFAKGWENARGSFEIWIRDNLRGLMFRVRKTAPKSGLTIAHNYYI